MPLCVNSACSRELSLGALFCDYCQTPGRVLGSDPDPWQSGVRLVGKTVKGRYRIEGVLRADETGLLYAATDLSDGSEIALRILPRKIATNSERLSILSGCVAATQRLDHVNLIPALGMDAEGSEVVLTFPRVEGENVARYLDRRQAERRVRGLPTEEALLILEGVADGLDALHRRGLVHRGIRPAVVVLTHDSDIIVPRVAEVGIAAHMRIFLSRLGKPEHFPFPYSSPEEIKGEPADRSWDIFALGCLAWELLLGRTPFPGSDRAQRILAGSPDGAAQLDDPIRAVLTRALDADSQDRWPSGRPFVEALARVLPRHDRPSPRFLSSARALPKLPSFEAPPPVRRQPPWGALLALLLVSGALITWTLGPSLPVGKRGLPDLLGPLASLTSRRHGAPDVAVSAHALPSDAPSPDSGPDPFDASPSPRADPDSSHASPSASPSPAATPSADASPLTSGPPPPLKPLGKNDKGFHEFRSTIDDARMVLVPRGTFWMGSADEPHEGPSHEVWLSPFLVDRTEVTVGQYRKFLAAHARSQSAALEGQSDSEPVGGLSWMEAQEYLQWAGKSLPTEAQWEKAARGGLANKPYPWGEAPPTGRACFGLSLDSGKPRPVASYEPNGYGIHDMSGNVWEWCLDAYDPEAYKNTLSRDPIAEPRGEFKVIRGGCFADGLQNLRVSARNRLRATIKDLRSVGFRGVKPWKGREP